MINKFLQWVSDRQYEYCRSKICYSVVLSAFGLQNPSDRWTPKRLSEFRLTSLLPRIYQTRAKNPKLDNAQLNDAKGNTTLVNREEHRI